MDSNTGKSERLPSTPEEILSKLTSVCNEPTLVKDLYPRIACKANIKLLPEGLVMMLNLAIYDYSKLYPGIGSLVALHIPGWIEALSPNTGYKKSALDFWKEVVKKANAEAKKNEQEAAKKAEAQDLDDDQLYAQIQDIIKMFFEIVKRIDVDKKISVSRRNDDVNPYYDQTERGLFLEYYYGHPHKLWTPWGSLSFTASVGYSSDAPWEAILSEYLQRLGAEVYLPEVNTRMGTYGPVYQIHKVDEVVLPTPIRRPTSQDFIPYKTVEETWARMKYRNAQQKN